jgi:hypothetical protein
LKPIQMPNQGSKPPIAATDCRVLPLFRWSSADVGPGSR